MDEANHRTVGGSISCEFRGGDSKHVRPATEAAREKEDVRTSSGGGRQGAKIVNTNGNTGAVGQRDG